MQHAGNKKNKLSLCSAEKNTSKIRPVLAFKDTDKMINALLFFGLNYCSVPERLECFKHNCFLESNCYQVLQSKCEYFRVLSKMRLKKIGL